MTKGQAQSYESILKELRINQLNKIPRSLDRLANIEMRLKTIEQALNELDGTYHEPKVLGE